MEPIELPSDSTKFDAGEATEFVSAHPSYRKTLGEYVNMLKDHKAMPCARGDQWFSCPAESELFKMVLEYYMRSQMQVELYDPTTETELVKTLRNNYVSKPGDVHRQYLLLKKVDGVSYVELHLGTLQRTFDMFSIKPSTEEWKDQNMSVSLTDRGLEASREPSNPDEWLNCAAARFVDWALVMRNSLTLRRAYMAHVDESRRKEPKTEPMWPERFLFEMYRDSDSKLRDIEDCEVMFLGGVARAKNKQGIEKAARGFPGGLCVLGVSGYGVGFMLARRKPTDEHPTLYTIDVANSKRPVVKYLKIEEEERLEGEKKKRDCDMFPEEAKEAAAAENAAPKLEVPTPKTMAFRLDINSVNPCWRQTRVRNGPIDTYMHAVSAQRHLVDVHRCPLFSVAVVLGTTTKTNIFSTALDHLEMFVYTQPTFIDERTVYHPAGMAILKNLPFAPALPSFLVVSTRFIVAVMANLKGKDGKLMPPHMWVQEIHFDPNHFGLCLDGAWTPFLINMPVLDANSPVPRKLVKAVESGETPPIMSGAFDAYDPSELLLGTYDGAIISYRFDRDGSGEVCCNARESAPYIASDYLSELAAANQLIDTLVKVGKAPSEDEKAAIMAHVGKFRCPITSIVASHTTHGGVSGPDCWWGKPLAPDADPRIKLLRQSLRVVCGYASGFAWQFGDSQTVADVRAHHLQPAAQREGGLPVSMATFGGIVALHEGDENGIVLFDAKDNTLLGSFKDPAKHTAMTGPKHVYQSLWMDAGRIVCFMPDGDIAVIVPLTPESIVQKSEQLAKRQEEINRVYAEQLKFIESKTAAMSVSSGAAPDAAMTDAKQI